MRNNTRTLLPSIVVLFKHWSMPTADVESTTPIAYLPPEIHVGLDPHCQIMEPKWDLRDLRKESNHPNGWRNNYIHTTSVCIDG